MNKNRLVRMQIDKQLNDVRTVITLSCPLFGWIKTIRNALGMTMRQFAKRMGVSQARISVIEASEIDGSLTIKSMKDAAESLNCKLVYFLIPEKSLEDIVKEQAERTVFKNSKQVIHSMGLENQKVSEADIKDFIKIQTEALIFEHPNKIWES